MNCANSNNSNSYMKDTKAKGNLPQNCKLNALSRSKNDVVDCDSLSVNAVTAHKKVNRVSSLEHVVPKVWKNPHVCDASEIASSNQSNFAKSSYSKQWKSVPRPQPSKNKECKSMRCDDSTEIIAKPDGQKPPIKDRPNALKTLSNSLPEEKDEMVSKNRGHLVATPFNSAVKPFSKIDHRPSMKRHSKTPGVATLTRMYDPNKIRTETEVKHVPKVVSRQTNAITSKSSSSPNSKRSFHPRLSNTLVDGGQSRSTLDCLSPKPFHSAAVGISNLIKFNRNDAEAFRYNSDVAIDVSNGDGQTAAGDNEFQSVIAPVDVANENGKSTVLSTEEQMAVLHINDEQETHKEIEVGVYGGIKEDQTERVSSTLTIEETQSYDGTPLSNEPYSTSNLEVGIYGDVVENEAPPIPPHDPPPISPLQVVGINTDASHPEAEYLPMSGIANSEEGYIDMSSDSEMLDVDYSGNLVVPPPKFQTKSKREYHEIDPNSPPEERDFSKHGEENEDPVDPPPLPPDNSVGRRSMMYNSDKRVQVVSELQELLSKKDAKTSKKLRYVEVEVGVVNSKPYANSKHRKTNYVEVTVPPVKDIALRDRSGSGTSEEGLSLESRNKKQQKNVKQKLQSIFSKEDLHKEQLTDFEKERNKKKRISGRFTRKKTKENMKAKKERSASPSNYDSAPASTHASDDRSRPVSGTASIQSAPVSSGSNASAGSSGDGEVGRGTCALLPPPAVSHHTPRPRISLLPSHVAESTNVSEAATYRDVPVPQVRTAKPYQQKSYSKDESTFLAYPAQQSNGGENAYRPKVSSFLHGAASMVNSSSSQSHDPATPATTRSRDPATPATTRSRDPATPTTTRSRDPPPVPSHKRLSIPSEAPSPRLSGRIPLPGMTSGPQPQKRKQLAASKSTPSIPSRDYTDSMRRSSTDAEDAVATEQEENGVSDSIYIAAEDVPPDGAPPLPERDETLYESITASQVVPPSPFLQRESGYNFLESEPLYQDYRRMTISHASSKRQKSESRRDKAHSQPVTLPEKWESELMSDDLGTSTLWRSIPEVVRSELAVGMSPQELKVQQSQFEVITSQASYLRSLNILVNHFMNDRALLNSDILPTADRRRLFSNIETVRSVEQKFLRELENHFRTDIKLSRVCKIATEYAKSDFKVYVLYIQNQVYQDRVLAKLQKTQSRFSEEMHRIESSPACNRLSLLSFLLLPMQRVTRLPLLVSAIVNATDVAGDTELCKSARHALGVVNKLVKSCNESARKMQQTEQLVEIAAQLDYSSSVKMFALVSQSRSLVKKGEMNVSISTDSKKASKTSKLWLFLFSDVLLITKRKSTLDFNSSSRYEVIDWAGRQFIAVNEHAVNENAIFLVILENQAGKRFEMTLMPLAQHELSRWETALNPPSVGPAGESVYETWDCPQYKCVEPYEALQPDELSLELDDVMQVLKKTSDGWLEGERMRDGESGWFPAGYCEEIEDEHVRARNMKNLYRTYIAA